MPKMSKTRRQRRGGNPVRGTGNASQPRKEHIEQQVPSAKLAQRVSMLQPQRPSAPNLFLSPSVPRPESLIFPAMVALGCWGMVIYFLFLSSETNHILFGGMAVLMALLWSFSFGIRVRKLLQQRART